MFLAGIIICLVCVLFAVVAIVVHDTNREEAPLLPLVDKTPTIHHQRVYSKSRQLRQQKKKTTIYPHADHASNV
jgi:hypothetical protein